mmetsp:Transcript_3018/g.4925  ORF Transcript_3018/g.4925 Transcript_3018/m.4925 type:complete len:240 (+) Transcript_3018:1275-1994(+)
MPCPPQRTIWTMWRPGTLPRNVSPIWNGNRKQSPTPSPPWVLPKIIILLTMVRMSTMMIMMISTTAWMPVKIWLALEGPTMMLILIPCAFTIASRDKPNRNKTFGNRVAIPIDEDHPVKTFIETTRTTRRRHQTLKTKKVPTKRIAAPTKSKVDEQWMPMERFYLDNVEARKERIKLQLSQRHQRPQIRKIIRQIRLPSRKITSPILPNRIKTNPRRRQAVAAVVQSRITTSRVVKLQT